MNGHIKTEHAETVTFSVDNCKSLKLRYEIFSFWTTYCPSQMERQSIEIYVHGQAPSNALDIKEFLKINLYHRSL